MIKAIIFDFDGLMVDTEMISYKCYQTLLKDYGISFSLDDYTKEYPGTCARMAIQKFKKRYQIPCETEEALHTIDCLEQQFIKEDGVLLKPGLRELLTYLKKAGYQDVVATSSLKNRALHILNAHIPVICIPDMKYPSPIYEKMTTAILPSLLDIISFLESNHDES